MISVYPDWLGINAYLGNEEPHQHSCQHVHNDEEDIVSPGESVQFDIFELFDVSPSNIRECGGRCLGKDDLDHEAEKRSNSATGRSDARGKDLGTIDGTTAIPRYREYDTEQPFVKNVSFNILVHDGMSDAAYRRKNMPKPLATTSGPPPYTATKATDSDRVNY